MVAMTDRRTAAPASRRERVRASTLAEIKGCALDLMREQGSTQVHFSDIARAMGMTAPALYRYFADRDDLLTALIRDAYNDLAERGQRGRLPDRPRGRLGPSSRRHAGLPHLGTDSARAVHADLRAADPGLRRRRAGRAPPRQPLARWTRCMGLVVNAYEAGRLVTSVLTRLRAADGRHDGREALA